MLPPLMLPILLLFFADFDAADADLLFFATMVRRYATCHDVCADMPRYYYLSAITRRCRAMMLSHAEPRRDAPPCRDAHAAHDASLMITRRDALMR